MAQQTAVQNLINELKQFKKFPMVDQPTIDAAIGFAELRLEMEKEQIINAYKREACYMKYAGCTDEQINKSAEKYYNETYNTQNK